MFVYIAQKASKIKELFQHPQAADEYRANNCFVFVAFRQIYQAALQVDRLGVDGGLDGLEEGSYGGSRKLSRL